MSVRNAICTNSKCLVVLAFDYKEVPAFCPWCGAGIIEKCPRCQVELPEWPPRSMKFCDKCGQRLRFDPDPTTGKIVVQVET